MDRGKHAACWQAQFEAEGAQHSYLDGSETSLWTFGGIEPMVVASADASHLKYPGRARGYPADKHRLDINIQGLDNIIKYK